MASPLLTDLSSDRKEIVKIDGFFLIFLFNRKKSKISSVCPFLSLCERNVVVLRFSPFRDF